MADESLNGIIVDAIQPAVPGSPMGVGGQLALRQLAKRLVRWRIRTITADDREVWVVGVTGLGTRKGVLCMHLRESRPSAGLAMRSVCNEQDADRYVAFYASRFDARAAVTPAILLHHHPRTTYQDFLFVEDEQSSEIVSTISLIPWHCCYEGITLDVAMLETVATHPRYRQRGLVRKLVGKFHEVVAERGFDLCVIEGIPYFYRQFGYAYAIDHWAVDSLPAWRVPDQVAGQADRYVFRPATVEDAPCLSELYQDGMATLDVHTLRDLDDWRFLLQWAQYPVRIVEDRRDGRIAGYLATESLAGSGGVRVIESVVTSKGAGMAILWHLKAESRSEIQLRWPQTGTLVRIARSLGSTSQPPYQWLLRFSDLGRLLRKIGPVLERRVARSDCERLDADLRINLFGTAFLMSFRSGRLVAVQNLGFVDSSMGADGGDLCIPPDAFARLIMGYRNLDELRDAWPDIVVHPDSRYLLDVLFPPMTSYLCMVYEYYGTEP